MREIVIVIADLYWPSVSDDGSFADRSAHESSPRALPGLEHAARFGYRSVLERGWRDWLARWLGRDDLAGAAPASIAAAAAVETSGAAQLTAWIATPVHLIAGLTSLHLDRRGILRLPRADLERLAADFRSAFHDSPFHLTPLDSGDFLMLGPDPQQTITTEPARSMLGAVADSLPGGAGAPLLRRLGAEIEMWLHGHPVNEARAVRGELPVSALWLWGGGPAALESRSEPSGADRAAVDHTLAFGTDAYLRGLCHLNGLDCHPLPEQLDPLFGYPRAQRAVVVVEVAQVLRSNPSWTVFDALAELDSRFISPGQRGLRRGELERLVVMANDRQLILRPGDRLKLWRRARVGIEGLR